MNITSIFTEKYTAGGDADKSEQEDLRGGNIKLDKYFTKYWQLVTHKVGVHGGVVCALTGQEIIPCSLYT